MARHTKMRDGKPVIVDAGSMHKYAAPRVPAEQGRAAHRMGLELQLVAAGLEPQHSRDYRRTRRINGMRRTAWLLVLIAALLLTIAVAPVGGWWQSLQSLFPRGS